MYAAHLLNEVNENIGFQGGNFLSECIDLAHDRPQNQFLHGRQARQRQQRLATAGRGEGGAVLSGVRRNALFLSRTVTAE